MADAKDIKAGSSSLVLGCDSYTSPAELGDKQLIMAQNASVRGGILQTRPGSRTPYCMPDGNLQGFKLFTPSNGVAHHVFMVDGAVYVSPAPFTSYRRLKNLQFSTTAKFAAWAVCLKSTDYDNSGALYALDNPYSILMIQDGLTRAGYWDGSTSGHLNPGAPAPPHQTDVILGYSETPIGLWMIWSGNRLWVSRDNQVFASDIGNPIKFTEATYLNEARAFYLSGPCTGMIESPDQHGILVFTEHNVTFFQSYIQQRTDWLNTPDFQKIIIPNIGCVAPRSLVNQYGLTWWFGPRGLTNINAALMQNITSQIDYKDNGMFSSKAYLGPKLDGICSCFYENYLMVSVPSADVLNRHTWVLDQAPFEGNVPAWTGFWTGWRPVEWDRGIVNGSERIFFASIDYDGKNRVWEAMLPDRTDNGCRITCYAQLRDHAAGTLDQKRYDWSKFFLSQIYGEVDLNVYVASTKGSYQLQKNFHIVASEGQIFSDVEYSEAGPYMMGNRVQTRTIRTPSKPEDNACNACGVESDQGNLIDYAFSHLLVWSGQMGIRAYQLFMLESPERQDGDCEEDEVAPRTLNAQGCSGLELLVDGQVFEEFTAYSEGTALAANGGTAYIRRTAVSSISAENAQAMADCAVQQTTAYLMDQSPATGVYETNEAEVGNGSYLVVNAPSMNISRVTISCISESGEATLCGFSEFANPSSPPKKYRKKTLSGLRSRCNFNTLSDCTNSVNTQGSDITNSGNMTCEYSAIDCSINRVGQMDILQDGSCPAITHLSYHTDCQYVITSDPSDQFTVTNTKTTQQEFFKGDCAFSGTLYSHATTTLASLLEVEDTESDAIARASKTAGELCTAFRESRGASDFSFLFRDVGFTINCTNLINGINYTVIIDILEENYGGGGSVTSKRTYNFTASGTTHTVSDVLVPASGKQLTASNPAIHS